jgi:phasin family protein
MRIVHRTKPFTQELSMFANTDRFAANQQAGVNALITLASTQLAAFEKLATLNLTAAKTTLEEFSEQAQAVAAARDPQELIKLQQQFAQPSLEKSVAYGKHVYDIAAQAQSAVTKLAESNVAEANRAFAGWIDQVAKSAPQGSDPFVSAFKNAFASANSAYDNFSKVAKQAADVVEVNFAQAGAKTRRK